MRILLIWAVTAIPLIAQTPAVQLSNTSRPGSTDFKVGDGFNIVITGTANRAVSVRTTRNGGTDWGPVIGWTDMSGRWSTTGLYEKGDFGDWAEAWTVGGKLATPIVHFSVGPPCLEGGLSGVTFMSSVRAESCETAQGRQTFVTPSDTEPFRTPDGRMVPGRTRSTAEQYRMEILQSSIDGDLRPGWYRGFGDGAATLITKIIGVNAFTEDEMQHVLGIVRAAFERPDRIPETAKNQAATLLLLRNLANAAEQESLKQQIAEMVAYVQAK